MTPRQRVLCALNRREPDRLPVDFAGTDCSSVHVLAYNRLRQKLGIEPRPIVLGCHIQQVVEADPELLHRFQSDVVPLYFHPRKWREWESGYGAAIKVPDLWRPENLPDGSTVVRDKDGRPRLKRPAGGHYFDAVRFPLAQLASPAQLRGHDELFARTDWPAFNDETPEEYGRRARQLHASTERAVVALWKMHYLQAGQMLRGFEQFLIDLVADPAMARGIFDRLHAVYLERARMLLKAAGDAVDIVFLADDLGTQHGPMIRSKNLSRVPRALLAGAYPSCQASRQEGAHAQLRGGQRVHSRFHRAGGGRP